MINLLINGNFKQSDKTEQVRLRSFDTSVHKVEALVAYRVGEEE